MMANEFERQKKRPSGKTTGCWRAATMAVCLLGACGTAGTARGQAVYISADREVKPPDYATFRLGPFYSTMALTESVGYRYTRSKGVGTDYLIDNRRSEIREDGNEMPIISTLSFRNYLILSRHADVDASFRISYLYYPMKTQDDEFLFDLVEEGIYATISSSFRVSPYVTGTIYERAVYRTDYVDTRGISDRYGGSKYEYFSNTLGAQVDWRMARNKTLTGSVSREDWIPRGDEFEEQERVVHRFGLRYAHELIEGMRVGLAAAHAYTDYAVDSRADTRQEDYNVFAEFDKGGRMGLPLTDRSTLTASLGVSTVYRSTVATDDDTEDTTSAMTGAVALQTDLAKNLRHKLQYTRGVRDGWSTTETYDGFSYHINWKGDWTTLGFTSSINNVDPVLAEERNYRDWQNRLIATRALAEYLTLTLTSSYNLRDNAAGSDSDAVGIDESLYNYETWVTRLSTGFQFTKKTKFTTYVERVERFSEVETLRYTRDTFGAFLTYHHQF